MTASHTTITTRIALREGQTLHTRLRAGTQIVVTHGCVQLVESPAWLGETMFAARATVAEGQVHCVAGAGWVEIAALAPTEIVQHATRPAAAAFLAMVKAQAARLVGQAPAAADVKTL
jgi:hypothetical protein